MTCNTIHIVKKHHSKERVSLVFLVVFFCGGVVVWVVFFCCSGGGGCFLPFQPYQPHFYHSKGRHQFGAVNSQALWTPLESQLLCCYPIVFFNPGDEINKVILKFMFSPHI